MVRNAQFSINLVLIFVFVLSSVVFINNLTTTIHTNSISTNRDSTQSIDLSSQNPTTQSHDINTLLTGKNVFYFTKNTGQLNQKSIDYYFTSKGYQINFLQSKIQFVQKSSIDGSLISYFISFKNSNLVSPIGNQKITQVTNYFIGKNAFSNIPLYKELIYYNVYSGIDLRYYFTEQGIKYDFIVHPGANPKDIIIESSLISSIASSTSSLSITDPFTGKNLLSDQNLLVYQTIQSKMIVVPAAFSAPTNHNTDVMYKIEHYNTQYDLIIDPVLVVNTSTYIGGTGDDQGIDMVLDNKSNIYITGITDSTNFMTEFPLNSSYSGVPYDIFVMKLNSTGNGVIWSTYFGGNGDDQVKRIGLDSIGNVVIVGSTSSDNLPIIGSQNTHLIGTSDGLLVVLSNDGQTLKLCSLIGGSGDESINGLFISSTNEYYLTGSTDSANFITVNAFNNTYGNKTDAFLIKISITGSINYSTFIGGNQYDEGIDVALDSQNNIYILGDSNSDLGGYTHKGIPIDPDIFVMKLNSSGGYENTTLIGGTKIDMPSSMVIQNNQVYITGTTSSYDFPTSNNAFDRKFDNTTTDSKAFVIKLQSSFTIDYSTYFGATNTTTSNKILVDSNNQAYIFGWTRSNATAFPLKNEYTKSLISGQHGFIATLSSEGSNITYSSIFGGNQTRDLDQITSGALGVQNLIYFTGFTNSIDYPVDSAIQSSNANYGTYDTIFTIMSPDYITPTLEIKPNFNYTVGTTGNNLTFNASDNDPEARYTVYENGTLQSSDYLIHSQVNDSIDGLSAGWYNYTVVVQDRSGLEVAKTTLVKVLALNTGTISTSNSQNSNGLVNDLLLVGLGIIGVVIIAAIFKVTYSKKGSKKTNTPPNDQPKDLKPIPEQNPVTTESPKSSPEHQLETTSIPNQTNVDPSQTDQNLKIEGKEPDSPKEMSE